MIKNKYLLIIACIAYVIAIGFECKLFEIAMAYFQPSFATIAAFNTPVFTVIIFILFLIAFHFINLVIIKAIAVKVEEFISKR